MVARGVGYAACFVVAVLTIACGSTASTPTPLADQSGCSFAVSTTTIDVEAASGANPVSVTASASGCSWTTVSNVSFIQVSPASAIGSGTATLVYSDNTAAARSGTAIVAGHTVTLNQAGSTTPTPLTGTWSGTWSWTGTGSDGCTDSDGGTLSITVTQTASDFSGSTTATGVETRDANNGCALTGTGTSKGTIFGTISGTTVNLSLFISGTDPASLLDGSATLGTNTLTGTFPGNSASGTGNGSFTLTKQ